METRPGDVIEPQTWCRQRWCREDSTAPHRPGDGCTCDPHGRVAGLEAAPRLTILRAHASRLPSFACRACGRASKRMVEYPALFFRCEPCAAEDRWPGAGGRRASG